MGRLAQRVHRQPALREGEGHVETAVFGLAARQTFQRLNELSAERLTLIGAPVVERSAVAHGKSCQKLAVVEVHRFPEEWQALVAYLARLM